MGPGPALIALLPQSPSHMPNSWHPQSLPRRRQDQTHSMKAPGFPGPCGIQGWYGPSHPADIEAGWKQVKGSLALVGAGEEVEGSQGLSRTPICAPSFLAWLQRTCWGATVLENRSG